MMIGQGGHQGNVHESGFKKGVLRHEDVVCGEKWDVWGGIKIEGTLGVDAADFN